MKQTDYKDLTSEEQNLLIKAKETLNTAYNPYSKFYVASALLSNKGEIITGSNIENASHTPTICAERAAIASANAKGIREITKIAIIAKSENSNTKEVTSPCGVCRQTIYELSQISNTNIEIIMSNTDMTKIVKSTINELLPMAFGPKDLAVNLEKYKS
ncbi:MAG: cytidine deaminase [Candidatus Woesearchaeota archaeon]